ncbi:MAG: hypothetical protein VKO19_00210, partial [Cyanobacteriota bacterium]|nr:hypothetical protein [Cyanobacteriota bacterium]
MLIPVFKGGEMFKEATHSVAPYLNWFDQVVISLNGIDTDKDEATALELVNSHLTILKTNKVLTP